MPRETVWVIYYWDVSAGASAHSVHRTKAGAEAAAWDLVGSDWNPLEPLPHDLHEALRR